MKGIVVCCGVGGAGKTTVAAAFALALAERGDRTVVLTIDPARRLADALGLEVLGDEPRPIDLGRFGRQGVLDALMLDRKATFDALVRRFAADEQTGERLLANRYYRAVSTRLTGSNEYMATEKLQQLVEADRWDWIVLDTPPAQHAIDFFEAPGRVSRLFEQGLLSAIANPGRGLFGGATRRIVSLIEGIAGQTVLQDFGEFFRLISTLSGALRERNQAVHALLRSDRAQFWLVTPPLGGAEPDVRRFAEVLRSEGMTLAGIVANRVVLPPRLSRPITRDDLPRIAGVDPDQWGQMADALVALPERVEAVARQHAAAASRLGAAAGGVRVAVLPELPGGVHTIESLDELVPYLPAP